MKTNPDGTFSLRPGGVAQWLRERDLWVMCLPQGDTACKPQRIAGAHDATSPTRLTPVHVELTCTSPVGAPPGKLAEAVAALAETHEVLAWAGVEELGIADAAVKTAFARVDATLTPEEREPFKAALVAAVAPLRTGARPGLPLLPSLQRDDFAEELIAAAPGWRWLTRPERNDHLATPYGERDGRFEGNVVQRVGSTFNSSLASLSEGPLSVDPETQASLELTWPASAGPRVCLEASPTVPRIGWRMREDAGKGRTSFTWQLSNAQRAGLKKDTMGIVARSCTDADREQGPYIPVRGEAAAARAAPYRLVFLFPRPLTMIYLSVFQGDGAARRIITLPPGTIQFDPNARTPTVTIDVPTLNLEPGLVHLEMSARGPGRFGPEQLSFLHVQRGGK